MILGSMLAIVYGLIQLQTPSKSPEASRYLACPILEPSKRAYELYVAAYTPLWIGVFVVIIAGKFYETFDEWSYLKVCVGLALPLLLQPFLLPSAGFHSPDARRSWWKRFATKANLWLAIYSFIGNYWYTHYFYSVLRAEYTMPSHRLNNIPIAMFFATHFYFSTYHFLSNCLLRKVVTTFQPSVWRGVLFVSVIVVFSYFTAFMETLSISAYPDWRFEDRYSVYTVGSAFYGIYFLVSYPAFFYFDPSIDLGTSTSSKPNKTRSSDTAKPSASIKSLWDTIVSSCGYGMIILILLDFVRLYLDIPLVVGVPPSFCQKWEK